MEFNEKIAKKYVKKIIPKIIKIMKEELFHEGFEEADLSILTHIIISELHLHFLLRMLEPSQSLEFLDLFVVNCKEALKIKEKLNREKICH